MRRHDENINKSIRTASANNENWIKVLDCAIKQVYFNWLRSKKRDPIFDQTPYKITDIKHTMITAVKPTGHSVTRNCKKLVLGRN